MQQQNNSNSVQGNSKFPANANKEHYSFLNELANAPNVSSRKLVDLEARISGKSIKSIQSLFMHSNSNSIAKE